MAVYTLLHCVRSLRTGFGAGFDAASPPYGSQNPSSHAAFVVVAKYHLLPWAVVIISQSWSVSQVILQEPATTLSAGRGTLVMPKEVGVWSGRREGAE